MGIFPGRAGGSVVMQEVELFLAVSLGRVQHTFQYRYTQFGQLPGDPALFTHPVR